MKKLNKKQIAALFTALAVTGVAAHAQSVETTVGGDVTATTDGSTPTPVFNVTQNLQEQGVDVATMSDVVALEDADASIASALSTEVSSRIDGDTSLDSALDTEGLARLGGDTSLASAVSSEASIRGAADTSLASALSSEVSTRGAADTSLASAVSAEASIRGAADTSLASALSTEVSTRGAADTSLASALSTEVSTRAAGDVSLESALSTEVSILAAADVSLESALSTEVSILAAADVSLESALSTEVSVRGAADVSLASAVSTEASVRGAADVSLASAINTEVSTRGAADVSLAAAISAVESVNASTVAAAVSAADYAVNVADSMSTLIRREDGGETASLIHIGENSLIINDSLVGSLEMGATDTNGDSTAINIVGDTNLVDDLLLVNGSTVRTTETDSMSKDETFAELSAAGLSATLPTEVSAAVSQVEQWQSYLENLAPSYATETGDQMAEWSSAAVDLSIALSTANSFAVGGDSVSAQSVSDIADSIALVVQDEYDQYIDASVAEEYNTAKIDLFEALINGEVSIAQSLAQSTADYLGEIAETYSLPTTAGGNGIQGIIDDVDGLNAGDNSGNIADIESAIDAFAGLGGTAAAENEDAVAANLADVGVLTAAISTALDGMPMITEADKNDVLDLVVNGGWEREAIQENTDAIASQSLSLAAEVSTRGAADVSLASAVSSEVSVRGAADVSLASALSTETDTRAAADVSLESALSTETDARVAGDVSLSSAVSLETDARVAGDVSLSSALVVETNARAAADASLETALSIESDARVAGDVSLSSALSLETVARVAGDVSLSSAVSLETVARVAGDVSLSSAISLEASSRVLADSSLHTAISTEVTVRTSQVASLVTAISSEATARIAADTSLSTKIDAEVTRAKAAESALSSRISSNTVEINKLRRGVAMAAALQTPIIAQGKDNAVKVGVAYFDGETGLAAGYARRISDSLQVNVEVATNSKFDETIARGGVNYSW